MSMHDTSEKSAVESEHQRLTRQLCRVTWESGFYQGAHQRLRSGIRAALALIAEEGADLAMVKRLLTNVIELDDQLAETKLKDKADVDPREYPPDHPAPGDLGSVPL